MSFISSSYMFILQCVDMNPPGNFMFHMQLIFMRWSVRTSRLNQLDVPIFEKCPGKKVVES